jgi:hypothetical protein
MANRTQDFLKIPERMRKIQDQLGRQGVRLAVIPPGPRSDIHENERVELIRALERELKGTGATIVRMEEEGESYWEFLDHVFVEGGKRVHVEFNRMYAVIRKTLRELGEDDRVETMDAHFNRTEVWGLNKCFKCGQDHQQGERCTRFATCHRCNKTSHDSSVCWSLLKMCGLCGLRGHNLMLCDNYKKLSSFREQRR